ncbi:myosin light chain B, putative (MLC-B) [Plasmodium ovale curtisi]|uniref:Myosin light chain B, putative (MLC-B) n=1 Tax=Plasmodium ovale curtisi TaxID=864141 RepID=A0A1A8VW16_PLAOA|nr:myosin light chain B, putative (MLC-B) [Plasmodium ovale curtisi]
MCRVNRECVLFKGGEKIQHTKKKQEFERISKIVNNIDFLNSLKNKVHNTDIEKIIEPLGIYAPNEDAQSEKVNRECVLFKGGEKIQHTKKKQEFERISKIVNNIDFLNSLKNKVHNTDIEKIIEPLGIYAPNEDAQSENEKESKNIYKRKLEALKKKYDGLRGSIDNRIDLELIKASAFHTFI